jgi:hypothetical protein
MSAFGIFLFGIYFMIITIVTIYLTLRSIQARNYQVLLLACAFMARIFVEFINTLEQKYMLRGFFDFNDIPLVLLFTKYAYHQRQKTRFPALFIIAIVLRIVNGVIVTVFQFDIPTTRALASLDLAVYYIYLACGVTMVCIAYGWLVYSAWSAIKKSRASESVPAWFKFRNKWIAIAFSLFVIGAFDWFLLPTDGSGMGGIAGGSPAAIMGSIIAVPTYIAIIFNAVAWITPRFIISRFNKSSKSASDTKNQMLSEISTMDNIDRAVSEKIISQRGIMDLVSYLGDYLAKIIGKPPSAVKGLIFISIQSQLGEGAIYVMKLKEITNVINGALKARLEAIGIGNVDEVVKRLSEKMVDEQSVLMMMTI